MRLGSVVKPPLPLHLSVLPLVWTVCLGRDTTSSTSSVGADSRCDRGGDEKGVGSTPW